MENLITPSGIIFATLFGLASAFFAHKRKKNPYTWLLIGFFFGIFGLFAIFFLPSKKRRRRKAPIQREKTVPSLLGPIDKFWYYLDPTHQKIGPISHSALTKALREGQISQTTYVWHENLTDWKKVEELR